MQSADLIRNLFAHHRWATRKLFSQLEQCDDAELRDAKFEGAASPFQTLHHMLETENFWFGLIRGISFEDVSGGFAPHQTLKELQVAWDGLYAEFDKYLSALDESETERRFTVSFPNGVSFSPRVHQVLSQLTVHSAQHRSELALMASGLGHSPGELDLWDFLSETNPETSFR
jgi:uncharacterized damage-inducible protein DinB